MKKRFFYSFLGNEQKEPNMITVLISESKLPPEEKIYFEPESLPEISPEMPVGATLDLVFTGGPRILKGCAILSHRVATRLSKKVKNSNFSELGMTFEYNKGKVWALREYLRKFQ